MHRYHVVIHMVSKKCVINSQALTYNEISKTLVTYILPLIHLNGIYTSNISRVTIKKRA